MLIENVNGVRKSASMLKNSEFYIEVAKFVQAYSTIIGNPNEFLAEINEPAIDPEKDKLNWEQFVKIVQKCDLGFKTIPTATDLVVFYNYALEIGTINPREQRIATVDDVADAQKHYYNFIDEAKDRAEAEYYRQKRIAAMREKEAVEVENKLSAIKAKNFICFAFMMIACMIGGFGFVSLIFNNSLARTLGSFAPAESSQYVGAAIAIVVAAAIFALFDKLYIKTKTNYVKLRQASATIFERSDENFVIEQHLKRKLNAAAKDLKVVQSELKDKSKRFDVKRNIENLKGSNKYYRKYTEMATEYESSAPANENVEEMGVSAGDDENEFAPIKLTKEQEENLRTVSKEAIKLEGQFDVDAYNEKFEKSTKKQDEEEKDEATVQQENQEEKEEELMESIDFIKNVLGFATNQKENEEDLEKSK